MIRTARVQRHAAFPVRGAAGRGARRHRFRPLLSWLEARQRAIGAAAASSCSPLRSHGRPACWCGCIPTSRCIFNPLVGGLQGAAQRYDTDYWVNSHARDGGRTRKLSSTAKTRAAAAVLLRRGVRRASAVREGGRSARRPAANGRSDDDPADFFIAPTHQGCDSAVDGNVIVTIERLGVPIGVVKDRRAITQPTSSRLARERPLDRQTRCARRGAGGRSIRSARGDIADPDGDLVNCRQTGSSGAADRVGCTLALRSCRRARSPALRARRSAARRGQHVGRVVPQRLGIGVAQIAAREADVGQHVVVETGQAGGRAAILGRRATRRGEPADHARPHRRQRARRATRPPSEQLKIATMVSLQSIWKSVETAPSAPESPRSLADSLLDLPDDTNMASAN